jgi:hypothetical protein
MNVDDDAVWRRPAAGSAEPAAARPAPERPAPPVYTGPPPTVPVAGPVGGPVIHQLPPPRQLPPQDHAALDAAERQAQLVSYGAGITIAVILALLVIYIALRQVAA